MNENVSRRLIIHGVAVIGGLAGSIAFLPAMGWAQVPVEPDPDAWKVLNLYRVFKDGSLHQRFPAEFRRRIRAAPSTRAIFFADSEAPMFESENRDYVDDVASLLVAAALSRISSMNFHQMVQDPKPRLQAMMDLKTNQDAVKERQEIVDLLIINSDFQQYTFPSRPYATKQYWAYKLSRFLTTKEFLDKEAGLLAGREPNWVEKMAWDARKIEWLDPTRLPALLATWDAAFPGTKIGEVLKSRSFYPSLPDWKDEVDATMDNVNRAIAVTRKEHSSSNHSRGGSAGTSFNHSSTTTYYGEAVIAFAKERLAAMKLWTGTTPNNVVVDKS